MLLREAYARERRMGRYETRVSQIRKAINNFSPKQLANLFILDVKDCEAVIDCIAAHPDWDNDQIAEEIDWED